MLRRTSVALAHGESVVLDASWADPAWRAAARRLADAASSDLVELRCVAPATVTDELMHQRAGSEDPSDATPEVTTAMTDAVRRRWPEAVTIDDRGDVEDAVEAALDEVDPAGWIGCDQVGRLVHRPRVGRIVRGVSAPRMLHCGDGDGHVARCAMGAAPVSI